MTATSGGSAATVRTDTSVAAWSASSAVACWTGPVGGDASVNPTANATNAAADRRRRRKVRAVDELSESTADRGPGPDVETDRRAFQKAFRDALAGLPQRQRMAVTLFDVEGYSHAEIAEILGIPQGTVRSDVFHARRRLRTALTSWQHHWKEEVV